jgi:hypothetical protein
LSSGKEDDGFSTGRFFFGLVHQVEDPVSASEQNNCTADDCGHDQDGHLNLLRLLPLRDERPQHQDRHQHVWYQHVCLLFEVAKRTAWIDNA